MKRVISVIEFCTIEEKKNNNKTTTIVIKDVNFFLSHSLSFSKCVFLWLKIKKKNSERKVFLFCFIYEMEDDYDLHYACEL